MSKYTLRVLLYAVAWLILVWFSLGEAGLPIDRLAIAMGLSLLHLGWTGMIGNSRGHARIALLAPYVVACSVLLSSLLLFGKFLRSGGKVESDSIRAVLQTNPPEALAYLTHLLSLSDVAGGLSIAVLFVALFPRERSTATARATTPFLISAAIGAFLVHIGSMTFFVPVRAYAREYLTELHAFRAVLDSRKSQPISGASSDFAGTAVIIIGESTSRHHMSRYGYFRETTPKLDARGDEVIAFSDVISAHSHTVPALAAALTSSGTTDLQQFFTESSVDLVSLAQSAGFKVHWLSNQNKLGIWDNAISVLAEQADQSQFFSSTIGVNFQRSQYDGAMLPALRESTDGSNVGPTLVFMHLFANHSPYCRNYPPEFPEFPELSGPKYFGAAAEYPGINCYDNGIRYIDSLIDESIQILDASHEPAVLIYFSDHGEAPWLGTAHDSFRHSSYHIEVPLLVWANDAYLDLYREKLSVARGNVGRRYTTARLFHSMAQLLGIEHASVQSEHSLLSKTLLDMPRTSINRTIEYDVWSPNNDYRENTSINIRALAENRKQVWAHRTNSVSALSEATAAFDGVEMDLVFIDAVECFHVYHPPAPDTSLSLSEMLFASKSKSELKLWLDWKNATRENMQDAIECLNQLDKRFGIRGRALVETGSDTIFKDTKLLSDAGYAHGYYLPTEAIRECIRTCDETAAEQLAVTIKQTVKEGGYSAITFDWRLSDFVRARLLEWATQTDLALYSWDMSINIANDQNANAKIAEHFDQLELDGLLVTFPSVFKN
jgi:glucan phosphoethanolaminetransferase (alkaline phosphatase superfamily)